MSLIRLNKNPSSRQLVVFGIAWLVMFGVYGAMAFRRHHPTVALGLWLLGAGFAFPGFFSPSWMRRGYLATARATYPLGLVVSYLLLAIVYYAIITPIGLILRIFGYDPLSRRQKNSATTYWRPRKEKRSDESYFHQY